MPKLQPVPGKWWFNEKCGSAMRRMFPSSHRLLTFVPLENIEPEQLVDIINIPVEFMVLCLQHGAWVSTGDWKTLVRYAIANRIRNKEDLLFTESFDPIRKDFVDFQLNGGSFKLQKRIHQFAGMIKHSPLASNQEIATAKLMLSTVDEVEINTLMQPFHWIRTAVGLADPSSPLGMAQATTEMKRQKITLCKMLRS
jgi:hypothetical protein